MKLQTEVILQKASFDIAHHSTILLLGSCFSENIGLKLVENKFSVNVNPFGVLYNPFSIRTAINRLLDKEGYTEQEFIHHNNMYHSFMHHGSFSNTNLDTAVKKVNEIFNIAVAQLEDADFLLITFGTSYVFRWKETGKIVGNCHKIPSDRFSRERLTVEEITLEWSQLIERLLVSNPNLKVIFTVSPIRHFRDGAHDNQLSKSILHLAIDSLMQQFPASAFYFPAYEIMMDQLRDYRFYADDMLHPSQLAQNYIWGKFGETYFNEETYLIIGEWQRIHQALAHRPYNSDSEVYQKFLQRTIVAIKAFETRHTFISCLQEKQLLTQLIQNTK